MNPIKKALVLCGEGINCEQETSYALSQAGFKTDIYTINELSAMGMNQDFLISHYSLLALPGGFSYGDELGSGRVLAIKIKKQLKLNLHEFANQGGMVIGICNGFQALIRLGVFGEQVSITRNSTNQFIDRWIDVSKDSANHSPWLKNITTLPLPIRHGEGRLIFEGNPVDFESALYYQQDVNGSKDRIAGLTTAKGRILGLMPHPEAYVRQTQHPYWTESQQNKNDSGMGLVIFKNAYQELNKGNTP